MRASESTFHRPEVPKVRERNAKPLNRQDAKSAKVGKREETRIDRGKQNQTKISEVPIHYYENYFS
jgi:hypothetical protein